MYSAQGKRPAIVSEVDRPTRADDFPLQVGGKTMASEATEEVEHRQNSWGWVLLPSKVTKQLPHAFEL